MGDTVEIYDTTLRGRCRAPSHPRLVDALTQAIGPNVQLHHTKMLVKPPEKGASFPMHQNYPYLSRTAGENPVWFERRPRYDVRPVEAAPASRDLAALVLMVRRVPRPAT
jgi:hypothetical protein